MDMQQQTPPRSMSEYKKDGTMVMLLVKMPEGQEPFDENRTEDDHTWRTIGFNALNDTGEDVWQMAGWDWDNDCFTSGHGVPIGWWPLPEKPAQTEPAS